MNSAYWTNKIMSEMYSNTDLNLYIGLSSTAPGSDGTNISEPVGGSYERVPVGRLSEPIDGRVRNISDIVFPTSTSAWFENGDMASYYVIFDGADSSSHYLSCGEFAVPREIGDDIQIKIIPLSLSITLLDPPESLEE